MANHKLQEKYVDSKKKTHNFRCDVCYRKWTSKPKGNCAGPPFKGQSGSTSSKGAPTSTSDVSGIVMGGQVAWIDRQDPLKRSQMRSRYLKNVKYADRIEKEETEKADKIKKAKDALKEATA